MVLLRHIWLNGLTRINYSEFVLIRGVPMFVYFVDTVVSHHEYICTSHIMGSRNLNFPQITKIGNHEFKWLYSKLKS